MATETCPKCKGIGWLRVRTPRGVGARQCEDCLGKEIQGQRLSDCGVPPVLAGLGFRNLSAGTPKENLDKYNAYTRAMNSVREFCSSHPVTQKNGLLFSGGPTRDLTALAMAAFRRLVKRGLSGQFCEYQDLLSTLIGRADRDPAIAEAGRTLNRRLQDADVLWVHLLGDHRPQTWVLDEIRSIIKQRYFHNRCLLATTALPLEEPTRPELGNFNAERVRDSQLWLGDRIGSSSLDMLRDHCAIISLAPEKQTDHAGARKPGGAASHP